MNLKQATETTDGHGWTQIRGNCAIAAGSSPVSLAPSGNKRFNRRADGGQERPHRGPSAVEFGCRRAKGLLSPALSSKGREGETAEAFDKSLNSMAAHPSPYRSSPRGEGEFCAGLRHRRAFTWCVWSTLRTLSERGKAMQMAGFPHALAGDSLCPREAIRTGLRASVCLISLLLFSATLVCAQNYSIDWSMIAGGGGTSTGGVFSVSGTIGQPDAGPAMTNGQYAVTGGFWALPTAVQTPGAPTLSIAPASPSSATISWTPNTPGFVLQESLRLSPADWINSPSGGTNPVAVPVTLPTKFYRLFKP